MSRNEIPLTSFQRGLFVAAVLEPDSSLYIEHCCQRIRGPLDISRMIAAIEATSAEYPLLTATLGHGVEPNLELGKNSIRIDRLSLKPSKTAAREVEEQALSGVSLQGRLTRFCLIEAAHDDLYLLFVYHHILLDAVSLSLLWASLERHYSSDEVIGAERSSASSKMSSQDLKGGQKDRTIEQLAVDRVLDRLQGCPTVVLPISDRSNSHVIQLPIDLMEIGDFRTALRLARCTAPSLITYSFKAAVAQTLSFDRFVMGMVVSTRTSHEPMSSMGCHLNTVLTKAERPHAGDSVLAGLRLSGLEGAMALQAADIPLPVVAARFLRQSRPRPRVYPQIAISTFPPITLSLDGFICERVHTYFPQAKFDLSLVVEYSSGGVIGCIQFRTPAVSVLSANLVASAFDLRMRETIASVLQEVSSS